MSSRWRAERAVGNALVQRVAVARAGQHVERAQGRAGHERGQRQQRQNDPDQQRLDEVQSESFDGGGTPNLPDTTPTRRWMQVGRREARRDAHVGPDERVGVGGLFERLAQVARAVAGVGLDADQVRRIAAAAFLQGGGVLERMRRHDAVVVVGGRHQRRRVGHAGLQVVQRRVAEQVLELRRVVARAVVGDPGRADRELLEAQHVHHADPRQRDL